jgi:GT2 family glycosyltransferase
MHDVFGAYLSDGREVSHSFMHSIARLRAHDRAADRRLLYNDLTHLRCATGGVAQGRNDLTRMFLNESECRWLWMVDSDMGFHPDTLDRLLNNDPHLNEKDRPIVGALCFSWRPEEPDGMGGYRCRPIPTIFGWDGTGFRAVEQYPFNSVIKVAGTGAACLLIHRSVMETLREKYGDDWWTPVRYPDGDFLSEDLSFCYRAGEVGFPLYVDTSVKTSHAKTIWVSEEHWATWNERGFGALTPEAHRG